MWGSWGGPTRGCTGCAESTWGPGVPLPKRGVMGSLLARSLMLLISSAWGLVSGSSRGSLRRGPPPRLAWQVGREAPWGAGPWGAQCFTSPSPCMANPLPAASAIPAPWRHCPGAPRGWAVPTRLLNLDRNQSKPVNSSTQPATSAPRAQPQSPLPWPSIKKKRGQRRNSHRGLQVQGHLAHR